MTPLNSTRYRRKLCSANRSLTCERNNPRSFDAIEWALDPCDDGGWFNDWHGAIQANNPADPYHPNYHTRWDMSFRSNNPLEGEEWV